MDAPAARASVSGAWQLATGNWSASSPRSRAASGRTARRSCCATAARICTVNLLACGLSTAMNSTPESINAAMNARLRDNRSSLSMTNLALRRLQAASAAAKWPGREGFRAQPVQGADRSLRPYGLAHFRPGLANGYQLLQLTLERKGLIIR
jgi:hypothetical protein